ncbi:MAG TPA: hypothetical protein VMH01_07710 [Puia sp.]|nr:hypothetical protein [Puia sp.]
MIRQIVYCCTGILLLAACSGNEKNKQEEKKPILVDSTASVTGIDSALSEEEVFLSNQMDFSNYLKSQKPDFDWKNFQLSENWHQDLLVEDSAYHPDKKFYEAYGRFLKYSPDGSFFIDLDSYNIDITKNKDGAWVGQELGPDTEVSLVDTKNNKKMRLIFLGPGGSIEDARWVDNNTILLFGVYTDEPNLRVPAIWKISLPDKEVYLYKNDDPSLISKLNGYTWKVRLKGISMR